MEGHLTRRTARIAATGACVLGLVGAAFAAPPSGLGGIAYHPTPNSRSTSARGPESPGRLDLTAPAAPAVQNQFSAKTLPPFPSGAHSRTPVATDGDQPPSLGLEMSQGREIGSVEGLARRVHQEGLPLARLWENKSALVSLGLNQRGKPGLWITQKVH